MHNYDLYRHRSRIIKAMEAIHLQRIKRMAICGHVHAYKWRIDKESWPVEDLKEGTVGEK